MPKRKAPPNMYWRGGTLWGRIKVKGTLIRWSLSTDDAKVAGERVKARKQREIAAAKYGDERRTWEDAVVGWGEHIISNVGPDTVKRYGVSLKQVEAMLRGCYLDEIDRMLMGTIIRARRTKGASNATIKRDLGAVSSVLRFCEDEGWLEGNAALASLRRLKERRDPIVLPEPAHIAMAIERTPGLLARLIEAAWRTGCRQAELVWLERRGLDYGRRQLTVIGKGNKTRTIDMMEAHETFRACPVNMRSSWVFWHGRGDPYANVSSRFAAIVRATQKGAQGFRPFRFHDLRHRFAVDYLKDGRGSIYSLQKHLGHESVKTTEGYLRFLTPEEQARSVTQKGAQ